MLNETNGCADDRVKIAGDARARIYCKRERSCLSLSNLTKWESCAPLSAEQFGVTAHTSSIRIVEFKVELFRLSPFRIVIWNFFNICTQIFIYCFRRGQRNASSFKIATIASLRSDRLHCIRLPLILHRFSHNLVFQFSIVVIASEEKTPHTRQGSQLVVELRRMQAHTQPFIAISHNTHTTVFCLGRFPYQLFFFYFFCSFLSNT